MTTAEDAFSESDIDLVRRVQQGSKEAYNILVLRYQHKVCDIAYKYVGNSVDANDIAQEAFIRAYRAIDSFRGESSFYTWLYRIVINSAKSFLEQNQRHRYSVDIDTMVNDSSTDPKGTLVSHEGPDNLMESEELQKVIIDAMNELPEDLKRAIYLREVEGLSYDDIAFIMKSPLGTVRSRIFRARQFIEEKMALFTKGL